MWHLYPNLYVYSCQMCGKWSKKKGNRKTHEKKHKLILVPSQRYKGSRHLLQNPTFPNYVMGFSNRAQRFTGCNYLDVESPFQILIFDTISMLHFQLPSSHLFLSFRYFFVNLTTMIKMVMSEVLTRILLHQHMLLQPLFIRVGSVALITIKLQILHKVKIEISMIVFPKFSVFSVFSAGLVSSFWISCSFIDIH